MLKLAIDAGAFAQPRAVHGFGRALELIHRFGRDPMAFLFDNVFVGGDEAFKRLAVECPLARRAFGCDQIVQPIRERGRFDAEHHAAVAFEKATLAVAGEARVAEAANEPACRFGRAADIQHGVQHSRHRARGAGAHRDKERTAAIAEAPAGDAFQEGDAFFQAVGDAIRDLGIAARRGGA